MEMKIWQYNVSSITNQLCYTTVMFTKGVKIRIYPTKEQRALIESTFGCCRKVYNDALELRETIHQRGEKCSYVMTSARLTEQKRLPGNEYLRLVDSVALQQSLRDLDRAYTNFFEGRANHPVFKSKRSSRQSYRTINQRDNIRIAGNAIRLPKVGWVKAKVSMGVDATNHVTVKRSSTGKYFVILNVDFKPDVARTGYEDVGIDVGLKSFYVDSNGRSVDNPKFFVAGQRKLRREQRRLARKRKGSSNYSKQRKKVALAHEKVLNQRDDFLHNQSFMLVRENQTICIETLNVEGMLANHRLSKSIADASWSKFFAMLKYKGSWYGSDVISVPTFYASSQTCSCCGEKSSLVKDLKVRKWTCSNCGSTHDRDVNAAINILNRGLEIHER